MFGHLCVVFLFLFLTSAFTANKRLHIDELHYKNCSRRNLFAKYDAAAQYRMCRCLQILTLPVFGDTTEKVNMISAKHRYQQSTIQNFCKSGNCLHCLQITISTTVY